MEKYKNFLSVNQKVSEALRILSFIGKEQRTTYAGVGKVHSMVGEMTVHYQPTDGATNYHESKELDSALGEAMLLHKDLLIKEAADILKRRSENALLKAEEELAKAITDIEDIKKARGE